MNRLLQVTVVLVIVLAASGCQGAKTRSGWRRGEVEAKIKKQAGFKSVSLRDWSEFMKGDAEDADGQQYSLRVGFDDAQRVVRWTASRYEDTRTGNVVLRKEDRRAGEFDYK